MKVQIALLATASLLLAVQAVSSPLINLILYFRVCALVTKQTLHLDMSSEVRKIILKLQQTATLKQPMQLTSLTKLSPLSKPSHIATT